MKGRTLAGVLFLVAGLTACDKIPWDKIPFIGKKESRPRPSAPAVRPPAQAPKPDTAAQVAAKPAPPPPKSPPKAAADEPWTPVDTGTVAPGMTRDQVIAVWGPPVAERSRESWTYLFFRNGCEATCGTFDTVFLENGQVVDAVVRGPGHTYAGVSSSPPGRVPAATPPGGAAPSAMQ